MAITLKSATSNNVAEVGVHGGLSVKGTSAAPTATTIAAASTGMLGPVDVGEFGNASFIVKNANPVTGWTGTPVIAFDQSDDGVSWAPLAVVRSDTNAVLAVHVLPAGQANTSIIFDAAMEGVTWVRARVTTGTTTGALAVSVQPGGLAFSPSITITPPARTSVAVFGTGLAVGATGVETVLTLTQQRGTTAGVSAGSYLVPAGKRLRLQSLVFTQVGNATAAVATTVFRLRYNPAGAATIASTPILMQTRLAAPSQAVSFQQLAVPLPDQYEIPGDGTGQFAITAQATYTTNAPTVDVLLVGYEF